MPSPLTWHCWDRQTRPTARQRGKSQAPHRDAPPWWSCFSPRGKVCSTDGSEDSWSCLHTQFARHSFHSLSHPPHLCSTPHLCRSAASVDMAVGNSPSPPNPQVGAPDTIGHEKTATRAGHGTAGSAAPHHPAAWPVAGGALGSTRRKADDIGPRTTLAVTEPTTDWTAGSVPDRRSALGRAVRGLRAVRLGLSEQRGRQRCGRFTS